MRFQILLERVCRGQPDGGKVADIAHLELSGKLWGWRSGKLISGVPEKAAVGGATRSWLPPCRSLPRRANNFQEEESLLPFCPSGTCSLGSASRYQLARGKYVCIISRINAGRCEVKRCKEFYF